MTSGLVDVQTHSKPTQTETVMLTVQPSQVELATLRTDGVQASSKQNLISSDVPAAPVPPMDKGFSAWAVVFASFVLHFAVFGEVYSFGVYFLEIQADFGVSRADVAWLGSLVIGVMLFCSVITGFLIPKLGCKPLLLSGAVMTGVGLLLTSYASAIWQMYLSYGVLTGIFLSFMFLPAVSTVQTWFSYRRGLATGLAVAGSGLGNFAFPIVKNQLIGIYGYRQTMRLLVSPIIEAAFVTGLVLLVSPLIKMRVAPKATPASNRQVAVVVYDADAVPPSAQPVEDADLAATEAADVYPATSSNSPAVAADVPNELPASSSVAIVTGSDSFSTKKPAVKKGVIRMKTFRTNMRDIMRLREFQLLILANVVGSLGYGNPFLHLVPYARDQGVSKGGASLILAVVGICSLTGRVALGMLADKTGRLRTLCVSVAIMGVASILWPIVAKSFWPLIVYAALYGFNAGAFVSLPPAVAADYFGAERISSVVGLLFCANAIPAAIGPVICGYIFDGTGSYFGAGLLTGASLLGAVCIWMIIPKLQPENDPSSPDAHGIADLKAVSADSPPALQLSSSGSVS